MSRKNRRKTVTPLYAALPLTDYRHIVKNGQEELAISDSDVRQMRDFSIENKK